MDLLATVRKEGSRGGRSDFKWSDVQNSSRREHYLGHSLMAPVGRWAKGRDLNWYAKGDAKDGEEEDPAEQAARERREEIKRVKEAEEDALARALGLPVPQRNNANLEPVSDKRHTDKLTTDSSATDNDNPKGLGYGKRNHSTDDVQNERIQDGGIRMTTESTVMRDVDMDLTEIETPVTEDDMIDPVRDIVYIAPDPEVQPAVDTRATENVKKK